MHSSVETRQDAIDPRIRVTNQRRGAKAKPTAGELVIKVDRSHPVLGNPFKLHNPSDDDGRAAVIAGYRKKFQKDLDEKGPMYQAALEIARLVTAGQPVCLDCWCAPKACHGDVLAVEITRLVGKLQRGEPV